MAALTPDRLVVVGGGLLAIAVVAYVAVRGLRNAAADAGAAAGSAVVGAVGGVVVGVGDAIGVPRTNETACEAAKREGRILDASFACPAGDFLRWLVS